MVEALWLPGQELLCYTIPCKLTTALLLLRRSERCAAHSTCGASCLMRSFLMRFFNEIVKCETSQHHNVPET